MKNVNPSLAFIIKCYFSHSIITSFDKKGKKKTTGQHIFVTTSFNLIIKKQSKKQGYNIIVKAQRFKYVILTESYTSKERYVLVNKNNYRTCYTMN